MRAGSSERHEDLSSFLAAPVEDAEEIQEQSNGLGYPSSASRELSFEDLDNQGAEVKLVTDTQHAATVSGSSDKLIRVNSLNNHVCDDTVVSQLNEVDKAAGHDLKGVNMMYEPKTEDSDRQLAYDYDALFGKSESQIDSSVRKLHTFEHSVNIKESAQMKAKGAIPKIPVIKNYSKPFNPMGHTKLGVRDIAEADRSPDFSCNPPRSSVNAITKLETFCQETTARKDIAKMAETRDKINLTNSNDEKAGDLLNVQEISPFKKKLARQLNGSEKAAGHGPVGVNMLYEPKIEDSNRQLVFNYDALFNKSKIDSSVRKVRTHGHSIDIKESAQMKDKGAIPKIPAMKNFSKPLGPMGHINTLSQRTCYLSDIGTTEADRPSNCSENFISKLETFCQETTAGKDSEDEINLANSTDEKAGDLLSVRDKFPVEKKLAMETSSTNGEKSAEKKNNETAQYRTSPRCIPRNRENSSMTTAPVGLVLFEGSEEQNCAVESKTTGSAKIIDLVTTAQSQIENLKIGSQKTESCPDRRDIGQKRTLGIANFSKGKTTERHQSSKANRNRPISAQRSKVSDGGGRKSGISNSSSSESARMAEKANAVDNARKNTHGYVGKVPEPKGESKHTPKKAAQYNDGVGKVKSKIVEKSKKANYNERPQERRQVNDIMTKNSSICKGKGTKVKVSQAESSNSVKTHEAKTVGTLLRTKRNKRTEYSQPGPQKSTTKKLNSSPKEKMGTPKKVSVNIPNQTAIGMTDVKGYLKNLLPSKITFRVLDIDKSNRENSTVEFPSINQASKAVNLLTKNSDKTGVTAYMVDKDITLHKDVAVEFLRTQKQEVIRKGNELIEQHRIKIDKQKTEIAHLKTTKFVRFDIYYKMKIEREALESKLEELTLQKDEFTNYHKGILERIEALGKHTKPNNEVKNLRLEFGLECRKLTAALPIYARRSHIIDTVSKNSVSVILGETGSGKSTQLVQYLHQAQNLGLGEVGSKMIVCTQPRKVAAQSLAKHVADEMGTTYGGIVGYRAGFVSKISAQTRVVFTTDHNLLNECLKDPLLEKYSCVIIDEAHERSIYTDLLLGMIKKCLKERNDLRVIVTSATIDPDLFVRYFGDAPVLKVSGRMFPVEVVYKDVSEPSSDNYLQEAVEKVREIHKHEPEGDMLVFLTSPLETQKACERLESTVDLVCVALHGQLQAQEQQRVFEPVAHGKRKVVFATNSAETSITIPGIKYIVDPGLVKEKVFDVKKNMSALVVKQISKSSAEQRKGRAGRMSSGKCYRLYTEEKFKAMDRIALPEILRVHLGQALLKLIEIGVADPLAFDFVQSPSEDALKSAMKILKQLKAVDQDGITGTGKRLALMPVEPRMGKVIFDAIEYGCGLEGIAVAALSSISGSVFYRMGTEEDKKQADYYKTTFCQPEGDIQTFLQVYKEWDSVPEKKKSAWCVKNYINGKSIRACRETIIEIQRILRKNLDINVRYEFARNFDGSSISNILLDCFRSNLGYFTGHSKSGFFVVFDEEDRFLQIHPSSSLSYLASTPKWVVFLDVLKTSSDYMLNVVTLEDSDVQAKIDTGDFIINQKKLDEITLSSCVVAEVGSSLMSYLIGPKFQTLKSTEQELGENYGRIVVLDVQREKSQIKAYTSPKLFQDITECLNRHTAAERLKLKKELQQIPVDNDSKTRAVLESGGFCSSILMPDETRTLLLRNVPDEWREHHVEFELVSFGEIVEVFPFRRKGHWQGGNRTWGKVTFRDAAAAQRALDNYEGNMLLIADGIDKSGRRRNEFKIRIQWCRRPTRGFAFAIPRDPEDAMRLSGRSRVINGSITTIRLAKDDPSKLFISKLSRNTTEDHLRNVLSDEIPIQKVFMPREKVGETAPEQLQALQGRMNMNILDFAERDEFSVTILPPKAVSFDYIGYILFSNPETGVTAVDRLHGSLFDGQQLSAYAEMRTSLHVQKDIYNALKTQLATSIEQIKRNHRSVRINVKELRSGHFSVNLEADSVDLMSDVRNVLQQMVSGHRIECSSKEEEQALFSHAGRDILTRLQSYLRLLVRIDTRLRTVTLYGDRNDIEEAIEEVQVFSGRFKNLKTREISLKGDGRPPGLMKHLMIEHGLEMESLRRATGVEMLSLVLQKHVLKATGTTDSIEKLLEAVAAAAIEIQKNAVAVQPDDIDCKVCFCPIDGHIYRLEYCGHQYCSECIGGLIKSGINSKQFPILCAEEGCEEPLVWKDFNNWVGPEQRQDLVKSSIESFVAQNSDTYKFCETPDCPMVYRVGYNEGAPYQCSGCGVTICTRCHAQYHYGLSCAMYRSKLETPDYELEGWVKENPSIRALCPNCKSPIEKSEGCDNMQCIQCKIHFCWKCKKASRSDRDVYDHLVKEHGGVFDF